MAKLILSDVHQQQLESMVREQRKPKDIIQHFKSYGIALPSWKIQVVRRLLGIEKKGKPRKAKISKADV